MLANKLKMLLAERNLTIKKVVNDTGLSRNTLSNIVNNPLSNIQNRTVNALCIYLGIKPADFFDFVPFDFDYSVDIDEKVEQPEPQVPDYVQNCSLFINVLKQSPVDGKKRIASIEFKGQLDCILLGPVAPNVTGYDISAKLNFASKKDKETFSTFKTALTPNLIVLIREEINSRFLNYLKETNDFSDKEQVSININVVF